MTLTFEAKVDARRFDVSFTIRSGETIAVMGPNGAGKSTLLGLLAGLLRPDAGSARLDDRVLFDLGARAASWTPPHRRGVSLLAQEALLFPHLTVLDNVAFGPRSAGRSRADANVVATEWLAEADATAFADRRPAQLSGGQAQRVAVARALASEPNLLLLDEPMSALDIAAAPALRRMLARVLADRTALIVTHDPLDALLLADRVFVIDGGRLVEQGATREVFAHPRTPFMAGLAGLNLLVGTSSGDGLTLADGVRIPVRDLHDLPLGSALAVVVSPADVAVRRTVSGVGDSSTDSLATDDSGSTVLRQTVLDIEPRGDLVRVRGEQLSADLPPTRVADLDLAPGDTVSFTFGAEKTTAYAL